MVNVLRQDLYRPLLVDRSFLFLLSANQHLHPDLPAGNVNVFNGKPTPTLCTFSVDESIEQFTPESNPHKLDANKVWNRRQCQVSVQMRSTINKRSSVLTFFSLNIKPGGNLTWSQNQREKEPWPLEHHRHSGGRTPLQSLNDLRGFIAIDTIHSATLDDLRGAAQAVV